MTTKPKSNDVVEASDKAEEFGNWLKKNHTAFTSLKDAVIPILTNLISAERIDYLAVEGRTKDIESAVEKVRRKDYDDPQQQMTDITGVRVIVYFESDVQRVSEIIRSAFSVDEANSSNTDERMSPNQVGYRSVHFVCDLGEARTQLPEYKMLVNLKFELQIRTVLQHAWAELAHDGNYKFSGSLPRKLERHLFLLAGLLETADQGFDELSAKIDEYKHTVSEESTKGDLDIPVDSLSLESFLTQWAKDNDYELKVGDREPIPSRIIRELKDFGVETLAQLKEIIPADFPTKGALVNPLLMMSVVRTWMIVHDADKVSKDVRHTWYIGKPVIPILENYFGEERTSEIVSKIRETAVGSLKDANRKKSAT